MLNFFDILWFEVSQFLLGVFDIACVEKWGAFVAFWTMLILHHLVFLRKARIDLCHLVQLVQSL